MGDLNRKPTAPRRSAAPGHEGRAICGHTHFTALTPRLSTAGRATPKTPQNAKNARLRHPPISPATAVEMARLARVAKKRHLSYSAIARATDVAFADVSRALNCKEEPRPKTLAALRAYLEPPPWRVLVLDALAARGMTVVDLALALHVRAPYLYHILNGKRPGVGPKGLALRARVATFLQVDEKKLWGDGSRRPQGRWNNER